MNSDSVLLRESYETDNESSEYSFVEESSEDEIKELEEANKLLIDLSKDLKTIAIENINFNKYFGEIDEEYVKSKFVKYIKDFIDNYHIDYSDPFNVYVENDIIFRMGLVLRFLDRNKEYQSKQSSHEYIMIDECTKSELYDLLYHKDNISIEISNAKRFSRDILLDKDHLESYIDNRYMNWYSLSRGDISCFNSQQYLEDHKECNVKFDDSMKNLLRITNYSNNKYIIVISNTYTSEIYRLINIEDYKSKEFKDLITTEINYLLLYISNYKLPTFSKFSLEGLNFQKFKDKIELKKRELTDSIEELDLKNKSIEKLISMNLKRNEELENQIKNKDIQIYNLNKQIDDLERTYKSFKRFEDFQGFFEVTSISEYQKLKQVEHDYQEYQKRSDEMKAYDEIIKNFELYRYNFLLKSRDYSNLMENHFHEKNIKYQEKKEKLEEKYQEKNEKLEEKYQEFEKAINYAKDKEKYWQNIIDHAEDHITSKLQKQLQEQIIQFSKFNSAKWDSQVSFNIISSILKSINHKGDLIRLGIETDKLEFKNLNEVLKCIQIFNMFGLCTNDKNESTLMKKFTFNFIDKINSYMKQFSILDPDYKK